MDRPQASALTACDNILLVTTPLLCAPLQASKEESAIAHAAAATALKTVETLRQRIALLEAEQDGKARSCGAYAFLEPGCLAGMT